MELGLTGKVALVTGSYRGTGQLIAQRLADEGDDLSGAAIAAGDQCDFTC